MNIYLIDKKEDLGDTLKILKPYGRIVLLDSGEKEVSKYKELYEDEEEKVIGIAPGVTEWSFPLEDLKKIKNLKGICTKSSWAFYIDVEYCKKNGIPVCNAIAANSQSVAEYAIWQMLSLVKYLPLQIQDNFISKHDSEHLQSEIAGKTMGVVGLGNVGGRLAKMGEGLGMKVIYFSRTKKDVSFEKVNISSLLQKSDFVFNCLENYSETKDYFNIKKLSLLQEKAYYISVMGGAGWGIEDIDYLIDRVKKGRLAGLSVENEHGKGYKLPNKIKGNIFISGAYAWYTKEARERTIQKWTDSIISCTKGMPINVVK